MVSITPTTSRPLGPIATSTPKPVIPRRQTLVRKRDDTESERPSSPGKKVKVTFLGDVEVRQVGESENAPQLVQEEVRLAFDKRSWSDDSGYEKIKHIYNPKKDPQDEVSSTVLRNYTMALVGNVASLNRSSSDLVQMVLNSQWLGREEEYVALFARLLGNLISTQGMFLADTMRMLVENLTSAPPSSGKLPDMQPVSRSTIFARVHKTLQYLLRLVPSASRVLSSVLLGAFPHQTDSKRTHNIYVENLLGILEYAPELRADVLGLITERLLKIDVQVQVDLEDLAEDIGDDIVQKIPQIHQGLMNEDDDDALSAIESEEDEEDEDEEAQRTKDITRNVEKMDSILDILFAYYDHGFSNSIEEQIGTVEILLSQFVATVLPTHRSRHTQFLIFHFVQQSPAYIDTFVGTCAQITFDRKQPAIMRQASAAYLASFVARGNHVPANIVRDVFDYLGSELERLRRENEPICRGPDLRRYSSYYALVQALLYIFCFRWRDLQFDSSEDDEDDNLVTLYGQGQQWRSGVKESLSLNIFSKLNPLKVCSPAIVTEFARVANHLGAIYVFHLIETNKRVRLSHFSGTAAAASFKHAMPDRETALSMSTDDGSNHLDEYFPFDPYHLPKSKRWIEGDYREWTGIPGLDDEEESESDSDEDGTVDSEIEEGTETDETG